MPNTLLVEDDVETLSTSAMVLSSAGFGVDTSASGYDALRAAALREYHAIVLDLNLPDMCGLSVLQQLRDRSVFSPVVIVSGYLSTAKVVTAMRLGAVEVLEKPLWEEQLVAAVQRATETAAQQGKVEPDEFERVLGHLKALVAAERRSEPRQEIELVRLVAVALTSKAICVPQFLIGCDVIRLALGSVHPNAAQTRLRQFVDHDPSRCAAHTQAWRDYETKMATFSSFASVRRGLGLPPDKIREVIRHSTSGTYCQWRRANRVMRTLQCLMTTDDYVGQVAYACGYEHHSQVDRDFRNLLGLSPKALRRLVGNET